MGNPRGERGVGEREERDERVSNVGTSCWSSYTHATVVLRVYVHVLFTARICAGMIHTCVMLCVCIQSGAHFGSTVHPCHVRRRWTVDACA